VIQISNQHSSKQKIGGKLKSTYNKSDNNGHDTSQSTDLDKVSRQLRELDERVRELESKPENKFILFMRKRTKSKQSQR